MYDPKTLQELQELIRAAAENGLALVPQSSAGPHLHGASENPSAETVSFQRMDRILKISRHDRYVRAEAGVSFGALLPEAKKAGLRLNVPFLPRAGKSAVASALERESGILPKYQFDYTDPLLTVETVYGDGEVFHTGSAAGPGPVEELKADMVAPWGPGAIDFLRFLTGAQGTMGFVTWATLKAEVLPSLSRLYFIESNTLSPLTELCDDLMRDRIPDDCVILNRGNFAAAFADSEAEERQLRDNAAPWTLLCRICGYERYPERRVEIYENDLKDACAAHGLIARSAPEKLPEIADRVDTALGDCDRRETYWKLRRGAVREILFLTPPSRVAADTAALESACAAHPVEDLGVTVQPQVQGRAYRVECDLFCAPEQRPAVEVLAASAEAKLFASGAFFDRPYSPALAALVCKADPTSADVMQRLKDIFDPAHILNPGKLCL